MHKKVAVEKKLEDVKEYFEKNDFQVDTFADYELSTIGRVSRYDAIIVSSATRNSHKTVKTLNEAPVIVSSGKTPDQVFNELK